MTENPSDDVAGKKGDEIYTEIKTDVEHDGEGTVYAILTVRQGDGRVDWKIGHIDGTFAEGTDYFYQDELFDRVEFATVPENAPPAKYTDETIYELLESEVDLEDGDVVESEVYSADGIDAEEWAKRYLTETMAPETIAEEWLEPAVSQHVEGEVE